MESPSRVLNVVISPKGARIPSMGEHGSIPLKFAELSLLEQLSRPDHPSPDAIVADVVLRTAATTERLTAFLDELRGRGLLLDLDPSPSGEGAPSTLEPETRPVGDEVLVARVPLVLRCTPHGFEAVGHDGTSLAYLGAAHVAALGAFGTPQTADAAFALHQGSVGAEALSDAEFRALVSRLVGTGILRPNVGGARPASRSEIEMRKIVAMMQAGAAAFGALIDEQEAEEAERRERTGVRRTRVVPVQSQSGPPPLALGMVFAYAKVHEGGRLLDHYEFVPSWMAAPEVLARFSDEPAIYMFSNYVWSHSDNLRLCASIKERSPESIMIHGGPDTPRYEADTAAFFEAYPHVDVAVHGEGELTGAELLDALTGVFADGRRDLSVLDAVPGLSYRDGDRIVRTADRERLAELDQLPSPYLTGLFDGFSGLPGVTAIIETNRGCPYGCTFCDWGSATLSRIRKFSIERVFAELEWCARNQIGQIFVADANFGIFERDVEIAEKVAELKATYGYPKAFYTNYAKNTVKHLKRIVQVMVEADILTEGLLSLQTMDEGTLATIKRSNIKVAKYDELASEFRKAGLPLFVDVMLGLPGSSTQSFRNDLQQCIDREVTAKIFQTEVLVNSPMNEPGYRAEHQIETAVAVQGLFAAGVADADAPKGRALVVSTATFTRTEYMEMLDIRSAFRLFENYGILRQVSRFLRQETGTREIDFIERLRHDTETDKDRWPLLAFTFRSLSGIMVAPVSWTLLMEEVREYLGVTYGVEPSSALDTVLAVQAALLPANDRVFPTVLDLPHDYAAWHRSMIDAKDAGHRLDWPEVVPHLATFGPARFEVTDPSRVCEFAIGFRNEGDFYGDWELGSPVARAMPAKHLENA